MGNCSGLHCPGCGDGPGAGIGLALAGIAAGAVVWHFAPEILRTITDVLIVAAVVTGGLVVLAVAGLAVVMTRQRGRTRLPRASQAALRPWDGPSITARIIPAERSRELPPARPQIRPESARLRIPAARPHDQSGR